MLRGLPLAWAATIVLALGVGWMGAQISSTLPSRTPEGGFLESGVEDMSELAASLPQFEMLQVNHVAALADEAAPTFL